MLMFSPPLYFLFSVLIHEVYSILFYDNHSSAAFSSYRCVNPEPTSVQFVNPT